MFLKIGNQWVRLIGDPHLGKKFETGVPLHRRGEREQQQKDEFTRQLNDVVAPDGKIVVAVIIMGDLFDGFKVSNEVIMSTYEMVAAAAGVHSSSEYLILMGNHDVSRNLDLVSSFDLLSEMITLENVSFIKRDTTHWLRGVDKPIVLCPYNAFVSTEDLFTEERFGEQTFSAAFGHWDTQSFGDGHNLLPYNTLVPRCDVVVSGHEHNPKDFMHGLTRIIVTGSMLPYSFAEDSTEQLYVTRTLSEVMEDPQAFSDKCLRIRLKKGEQLPENIDALQIIYQYVNEEEAVETQVTMEEFSVKTLFDQSMTENEVPEDVSNEYWGRYQNASQA